jgi:DNA polymerase-3 subunit delta
MPTTLNQLHKHLAGSELKPAYLLAGEEHLLVLEAADALRARARALGYAEREVLDAEGSFDWNELTQSACAMSLFAARKVIDLRLPTGKPGKDGAAAIEDYCTNPPPDTVLLITCTQWSKAHAVAWVSSLERIGLFIPIWPLKVNELFDWIQARLLSRGLKPTRDAVTLFVDRMEGNLLAAAQEIDKLALLCPSGQVDAQAIENLVADSARFDAVRLAKAGSLAAAFRNERVWPAREGIYRKALTRGDHQHWQRCLIKAAQIDRISKGRAAGDAWRELERLLLAMALPQTPANDWIAMGTYG